MFFSKYPSRGDETAEELFKSLDSHMLKRERPAAPPRKDEGSRVKTRFLSFGQVTEPDRNETLDGGEAPISGRSGKRVLAKLTIVGGPGRGEVFRIDSDFVQIGRGDGQDIQLAFGDDAVSRKCHASIANYGHQTGFVIRDGMKPNPVLLNGNIISGDERLKDRDLIRIGNTTLRFRCVASYGGRSHR